MSLIMRGMLLHHKLRKLLCLVCLFSLVLCATNSFAAIPLITDDTGTQGKGNFQLELSGEYGHHNEPFTTTKTGNFSLTLTYGIIDNVDIILGVPYQAWSTNGSGSVSAKGDGFGDLSLEAKWRLYEKDDLSFGLKPGFTIPTGDFDKNLGAGRPTYHLLLLATKKITSWEFDMNIGYLYNSNSAGDRKNIWSASLDALYEVMKDLKLVLDTGFATNPDSSSDTPPVYILGGLIWSLRENLDIGLGIKGGLTKPAPEYAVRGGVTWRF